MGDSHGFSLGSTVISDDLVAFSNLYSIVFVNPSPFLPGHVVVAPIRCRRRLCDFTNDECTDLFMTVKAVVSSLGCECDAFTVYMQDGTCADETGHVHVHVVPRKKSDIQDNEDIYKHGALRVVGSGSLTSSLREYAEVLRRRLEHSNLQR